ncbi:MAG: glycosyltransferase family 4 protein, partial [candidate division WOR-3 bacterium]|nr:glycosyltransferase family 4 protein [candidate division WOR-3 bacterium]
EEFYRNCDVFVLPAIVDSKGDTEGLGVVLLEAMSYKKPVIGTNLGGIIDIIKDGKTGLLVEEKNPELLAQAISRILGNESFAQQLAENGYNYARGQYGWDVIISRLIKLYAQTQ